METKKNNTLSSDESSGNTYFIFFIVFLALFILFLVGFIYYWRKDNTQKVNQKIMMSFIQIQ